MKNINAIYIRTLNPCESGIVDFENKYPKFNNTLSTLLSLEDITYTNKIWLATRVVDYKILQQWSVECAEFVVDNYNKAYPGDTRVSDCIEMTKRYLSGDCSKEELSAARSAAWSAESAAWSARSAAKSAAWSAAYSAYSAYSADSAESAAWSAESAAWSAYSAAKSAAYSAAYSAAESAAAEKQEDINISLLIALLED